MCLFKDDSSSCHVRYSRRSPEIMNVIMTIYGIHLRQGAGSAGINLMVPIQPWEIFYLPNKSLSSALDVKDRVAMVLVS